MDHPSLTRGPENRGGGTWRRPRVGMRVGIVRVWNRVRGCLSINQGVLGQDLFLLSGLPFLLLLCQTGQRRAGG